MCTPPLGQNGRHLGLIHHVLPKIQLALAITRASLIWRTHSILGIFNFWLLPQVYATYLSHVTVGYTHMYFCCHIHTYHMLLSCTHICCFIVMHYMPIPLFIIGMYTCPIMSHTQLCYFSIVCVPVFITTCILVLCYIHIYTRHVNATYTSVIYSYQIHS